MAYTRNPTRRRRRSRPTSPRQATTIGAWNPSNSYSKTDLTKVRGELVAIENRQAQIVTTIGEDAAWRAQQDDHLAMVTRAVIFLVRQNANQILDQP